VMHFDAFKEKFNELSKEDIVKGIYGFMFENTLKRYQKAQDIDLAAPRERGTAVRATTGMQKFFINLGTMDGATSGDLIKFVSQVAGINSRDIGRIDAKEKFAFIEAAVQHTDAMLKLKGELYGNRRVAIELASAPTFNGGPDRGARGFSGGRSGGGFRGRSGGGAPRGNRY
jgi:ATP-dependent RNA helicase DeaD